MVVKLFKKRTKMFLLHSMLCSFSLGLEPLVLEEVEVDLSLGRNLETLGRNLQKRNGT